MTVVCGPSSAEVSARAVPISSPEMAKKSVLLVVNVPENCDPSDIEALKRPNAAIDSCYHNRNTIVNTIICCDSDRTREFSSRLALPNHQQAHVREKFFAYPQREA
jgi:hypothetical protein